VGERRVGTGAWSRIRRDFHAAQRLEAIRLSHGQSIRFACLEEMATAVRVLVELAGVWAE
jgi:hypothetical protein